MDKGIVYIQTNPTLDGWVKIGVSAGNDIGDRFAELNRPANPLAFWTYAVYEVEKPREIRSYIHNLFDIIDADLHTREKLVSPGAREREFFHVSPEKAFDVFMNIANLRGDAENLKLIASGEKRAT